MINNNFYMKEIYQLDDFLTISKEETELKIFLNYLPENLNYMVPVGIKRLIITAFDDFEYDESKINLEMLPETLEYLDIIYLHSKVFNNLPKSLKTLHFDSLVIGDNLYLDEVMYEIDSSDKLIIPSNIRQLQVRNIKSLSFLQINHSLERLIIHNFRNFIQYTEYDEENDKEKIIRDFIKNNHIIKTYMFTDDEYDFDNDGFWYKRLESTTPMELTSEIFKLYLECNLRNRLESSSVYLITVKS